MSVGLLLAYGPAVVLLGAYAVGVAGLGLLIAGVEAARDAAFWAAHGTEVRIETWQARTFTIRMTHEPTGLVAEVVTDGGPARARRLALHQLRAMVEGR